MKLISSLLMMRPNKIECLCLANTFQSSLTFAGSTRSLPNKEASERSSDWVCPQILRPDWKGFPMANPLAYWASLSVMKEKSFITLTPGSVDGWPSHPHCYMERQTEKQSFCSQKRTSLMQNLPLKLDM